MNISRTQFAPRRLRSRRWGSSGQALPLVSGAYTVLVQGPPGNLVSFRVTGDSAHVVWNLGPEEMFVDLRGVGDSLTGQWSTVDWHGQLRGARRRVIGSDPGSDRHSSESAH